MNLILQSLLPLYIGWAIVFVINVAIYFVWYKTLKRADNDGIYKVSRTFNLALLLCIVLDVSVNIIAKKFMADLHPDMSPMRIINCILISFYVTYSIWMGRIISSPETKWKLSLGGGWWDLETKWSKLLVLFGLDVIALIAVLFSPVFL